MLVCVASSAEPQGLAVGEKATYSLAPFCALTLAQTWRCPGKKEGSPDYLNQRVGSCFAGFRVVAAGFGVFCVLQGAGLIWHLSLGQSPS